MTNTVFDNNILYVMEYGPSIFRSTDFGNTFSVTYQTGNYNWGSAVCLEDPGFVIGSSYSFSGPSYITYNGGANWRSFPQGSNSFQSGLISPDKSYALSYSGDGVFKLKAEFTGTNSVHQDPASISFPESYTLYQNYPNPFNPKTTITYSIPNSQLVALKIYDILGNEVSVLHSGRQNSGTYTAEWDASGNSSGIYFYTLTAGSFSKTMKMIVLK
ncbi:MAG: T9SS type A sorting domain-containing protein [Ignavibacteria bacterium]|nr:T9SS type A sorting domain-containing protein [Ignavibacteria bacterium]